VSGGTNAFVAVTGLIFNPTTGSAGFQGINLSYTVNQTLTANGTATGLRINGTETSVLGDHKLITAQTAGSGGSVFQVDRFAGITISQGPVNAGLTAFLLFLTSSAMTNLAAGTEAANVYVDSSASKQWATGSLTTQRENVFVAPSYSFVGASTITTAATFAITGAPAAGTNATITNSYSLWIQDGAVLLFGDRP